MADSSFDIVSKIDRQEVDNALGQTAREIATRFDFKGTGATIEWQGEHAIEISASADDRASAVLDVFKDKLVKRQQSLKILDAGEPRQSGQLSKISIALKEGITSEDAKKISKLIRDEGPKGVKAQIQGDELRVSSKKRDDLQAVQALVAARTTTSRSSSPTTADRARPRPLPTPVRRAAVARTGPRGPSTRTVTDMPSTSVTMTEHVEDSPEVPRDAAEVGVEESRAAWAEAARPILIEVAQHYHAVITYKDLATEAQRVTGIQGSQQMHYWIGDVLNRVSRDAFGRGEPLLSALCVKADGTVGERYAAAVAETTGDLTGDGDDHAAVQRLACYRYFQAPDLPAEWVVMLRP